MSLKDDHNNVEKSKATKDTIRQKYQQELAKHLRPKINEVTQQLMRMPKEPWIFPDRANNGISYVLSIKVDAEQKNNLSELVGCSDFLDFSKLATQISVVQAKGYRRIESLNDGLFGQNFVYINNPTGDILYLDPKHKVYLQLESSQVPQVKIADDPINIDVDYVVQEGKLIQGRGTKMIIITSVSPTRLRWVLWLAQDEELQPFFNDVFDTLLGPARKCKTMVRALHKIREIGIPLQGEIFLANSKGIFFSIPVLQFGLNDLKITEINQNEFAIPDNYLNLRQPEENKARMRKKRFHATTSFHSSDIQRGMSGRPQGIEANQSLLRRPHALSSNNLTSDNPNEFGCPDCLGSTYNSQVLFRIEQVLLSDIKYLINSISRRLSTFNGDDGSIKIDWLEQLRQYSASLPYGDILYCLLRDAPIQGDPDPEEAAGGKGLLDILARQQAERALFQGTIPTDLVLPEILRPLAQDIYRILSDPSISAEDRWDALGQADQILVREVWLQQHLANLNFTYSDSWGPKDVFHGLLRIQLWDIDFSITLGKEIIDQLVFQDGQVKLLVKIPAASAYMKIARWVTGKYIYLLLAGAVGCKLIPGGCALLSAVAAVTTFIALDIGEIYADIKDLMIDSMIGFTEDGDHVLKPVVNVAVDGEVSVDYETYIPEPVHAITDIITGMATDWGDTIFSRFAGQLKDKMEKVLKDDLGLIFPPAFAPASISAVRSTVAGVDNVHLRLWSDVLPSGLYSYLVSPYTTQTGQIDAEILERLRVNFSSSAKIPPRLLGGFAVSQNLLNHLLYMLWNRGDFTKSMLSSFANEIVETLQHICGECQLYEPYSAQTWLAVPPRIILTPRSYFDKLVYATAFFDDVRLCFTSSDSKSEEWGKAEFKFAAQTSAQIGFGRESEETGQLDMTKVSGRFMDVYFDLKPLSIQIIHPEVHDVCGIGPGLSPIQVNMVDAFEKIFIEAMQYILASHNDKYIPPTFDDKYSIRRYRIGDAGEILVRLYPYRGIIYGQLYLYGFIEPYLPDEQGEILFDINSPGSTCRDGEDLRNQLLD